MPTSVYVGITLSLHHGSPDPVSVPERLKWLAVGLEKQAVNNALYQVLYLAIRSRG